MLGESSHTSEKVLVAGIVASDGRALVHQCRQGHIPAIVDIAEAVIIGHAHFVEEDLIERRATGHLLERADLHVRIFHVDDEAGQSLVLGEIPVGAGDDLTDIGVVRTGGPHLLAGDHPFISIALSFGGQGRKVRSGAGLGEQLAGDHFAAPQLLHVQLAGNVRAVVLNCRGDHSEADAEWAVVGNAELDFKRAEDAVVRSRKFASAVFFRSADPAVSGIELLLPPRLGLLGVLCFLLTIFFAIEVVRAFAPHECLFNRATLGDGFKPCKGFFFELLDADLGHVFYPSIFHSRCPTVAPYRTRRDTC